METAWSVFYGAVGTLGMLHGIADAFQIPYDQKMIFIWIVLSSVIWGIAFGWKRHRKYLFPAAVGLFVWIGLWRWKEICEGICRSMERMTEAINAYYQFSWDTVQYVKTGGISTEQTAILVAGVFVSGLLVGGFLQKKGRILLAVLFAFGFLAPFLVGKVPENRTVWELLIGIMGLLAMQTALPGKQRKIKFFGTANGMLIGIAALAFVGGACILEPLLQTIFPPDSPKQKLVLEELWQDIRRSTRENVRTDIAAGGIGNGDLSAADRLEPGKEPQLKVTVGEKPQTDLYLYGYIGADYNRKQWERLESSARDQLGRREALEERKGDVYRWLKEKKDEKKLSVEYEDTEKAYEYLPYGSKIRNEQEVWGDTYVKGTGKTTYTTSFCELSEADWQERTGKKCEEIICKSTHNRRERPVCGHRGRSRGPFYYRITTFGKGPWDARDPHKTTFMALKHVIRLSIWQRQKETPGVEKAPGVSSPQRKESGRSGRDDGELRFGYDPAIHARRLRVYHRPRRLRMASRISIFFAARRFEPLNSMG